MWFAVSRKDMEAYFHRFTYVGELSHTQRGEKFMGRRYLLHLGCKVPDCPGPHLSKGYCTKHYQQWKYAGRPDNWSPTKPTGCKVPDCPNPHRTKGYCHNHYTQWWKAGRPDDWVPPVRPIGCKVPDCPSPHRSKGYCYTHYTQWWKAGRPDDWTPKFKAKAPSRG